MGTGLGVHKLSSLKLQDKSGRFQGFLTILQFPLFEKGFAPKKQLDKILKNKITSFCISGIYVGDASGSSSSLSYIAAFHFF